MSRAVDPDAARAELPAVEHEVVGLRAHGQRVGRQHGQILGVGHGERVVRRLRIAVGVEPSNIGKSTTQHVAVRALADRRRAEADAQRPEHRAGRRGSSSATARTRSPGSRRRSAARTPPARASERWRGRAGESSAARRRVDHAEPGQARRARLLGLLGQLVEPGAGEGGAVGRRTSALTAGAEKAFTSVPANTAVRSTSSMPKRRSGLSVP